MRDKCLTIVPPVTIITFPDRLGMSLAGLKSLRPSMLKACVMRLGQHVEREHTAILYTSHTLCGHLPADEKLLGV
jgi:hypothetical protein